METIDSTFNSTAGPGNVQDIFVLGKKNVKISLILFTQL